jgi:hypothetical protein
LTHLDQKKKKKKHLYWDEDKKFKIWDHFDEVVAVRNDIFKIVCKRCNLVLKHLSVENDINIAKTHLKFKQCLKIVKAESLSQLTIIKNWKKIKHFIIFSNVDYYKDYCKYSALMNICLLECELLQRLLQMFEKIFELLD